MLDQTGVAFGIFPAYSQVREKSAKQFMFFVNVFGARETLLGQIHMHTDGMDITEVFELAHSFRYGGLRNAERTGNVDLMHLLRRLRYYIYGFKVVLYALLYLHVGIITFPTKIVKTEFGHKSETVDKNVKIKQNVKKEIRGVNHVRHKRNT